MSKLDSQISRVIYGKYTFWEKGYKKKCVNYTYAVPWILIDNFKVNRTPVSLRRLSANEDCREPNRFAAIWCTLNTSTMYSNRWCRLLKKKEIPLQNKTNEYMTYLCSLVDTAQEPDSLARHRCRPDMFLCCRYMSRSHWSSCGWIRCPSWHSFRIEDRPHRKLHTLLCCYCRNNAHLE